MHLRAPTALLGLCFGLVVGIGCNTTARVGPKEYGDEAAEEHGVCIIGDIDCECLSGGVCDNQLTCMDGICRCVSGPCMEPPSTETDDGEESSGSETATESDSGSETATESDSDSTDDTTDDSTDSESSSEDSTDTDSSSESSSDTTDSTSTDSDSTDSTT